MSTVVYGCALLLVAVCSAALRSDEPAEELPPPVEAERAAQPPAHKERSPELDAVQSPGWRLAGSRGQHFLFGRIAVADYWWDGEHLIVLLERQSPGEAGEPDPDFLYYREMGSGRRWAFGRVAASDGARGRYVVYTQPAGARGAWELFHQARLESARQPDDPSAGQRPEPLPACGNEKSVLRPGSSGS